MPKFSKIITIIALAFSLVILLFLAVDSVLFTAVIEDAATEATVWQKDMPWLHLIVFVAVTCVLVLLRRRPVRTEIRTRWVFGVTGVAMMVVCLTFIVLLKKFPDADQVNCLLCGRGFATGDFISLSFNQYLGFNPHNLPLSLYFSLVSFVFGGHDYIVLQGLNAVFLLVCHYCLIRITQILFASRFVANLTAILLAGFLPMMYFVTFLYGNIVGLMFALLAILFQLKAIAAVSGVSEGFKNRCAAPSLGRPGLRLPERFASCALLSGAFVCIGILLRQNNLIVLIVMTLLWIFTFARFRSGRRILPLAAALTIACAFLIPYVPKAIVSAASDSEFYKAKGMPMSSYIAMGMQEGERAPGWYNSYNNATFIGSGFDTAVADEIAKQEIKDRLSYFEENPGYAIGFYYKKISSMWNNPTFQGVWILNAYNEPALADKAWGRSFLDGEINDRLCAYMNLYQTQILVWTLVFIGALIFGRLRKRRTAGKGEERDIEHEPETVTSSRVPAPLEFRLIPLIIFLGGFLFHVMWEAHAQYAFVYFYMLIPYAAASCALFCRWSNKRYNLVFA